MTRPESSGSPADAVLHATRRYLRAYPSAALCVGITHRGVHHVQALRHEGSPPAAESLYELGFLTQVFTGSLLALLVDRGEARLDTPLKELLPLPLLPNEVAGRITLEQLATHTSGMPHVPPNLRTPQQNPADPYGHYSAELFGAFLRSYQPKHPPPRKYVESVIGMGVLGHVLSRRLRLNYGHAVRDHLCTPLQMGDTIAVRLSEEQERRLLPGHSARGLPVPGWTFPSLPGAGALRSTVPDLLRFLDANLGHQDAGLGRAMRLAHSPRAKARGMHVGLGWNVSDVRGKPLVWCSSVTGGYAGFIGFSAETDTGVVVLSDHSWSFLASLRKRVPVEEPGFSLLTRYPR
ncbi:serine hydrolase [Vitiosangium sp. GDMCC 1.1324]|uniref:serine hydrolase domain-containing protein n=1 Tax=Vitiosangium sp. (strain GDMCC 1.1324) TaxID=2138576 RepID=UPI000D343387|nr:serine hydrolase domain-containing protein [Vitiosangium sp. GDMCC 1.1324]PTL77799.1 serine hydrolase [Vitiosangium sp. GDMCC 1.1324]